MGLLSGGGGAVARILGLMEVQGCGPVVCGVFRRDFKAWLTPLQWVVCLGRQSKHPDPPTPGGGHGQEFLGTRPDTQLPEKAHCGWFSDHCQAGISGNFPKLLTPLLSCNFRPPKITSLPCGLGPQFPALFAYFVMAQNGAPTML